MSTPVHPSSSVAAPAATPCHTAALRSQRHTDTCRALRTTTPSVWSCCRKEAPSVLCQSSLCCCTRCHGSCMLRGSACCSCQRFTISHNHIIDNTCTTNQATNANNSSSETATTATATAATHIKRLRQCQCSTSSRTQILSIPEDTGMPASVTRRDSRPPASPLRACT